MNHVGAGRGLDWTGGVGGGGAREMRISWPKDLLAKPTRQQITHGDRGLAERLNRRNFNGQSDPPRIVVASTTSSSGVNTKLKREP